MAVNGVIFNSKIKQLISWEGDIVAASKNLLHLCHHKRNCLLNCHHFLQCHHSYHRHHFYHRHQLLRIRRLLFSEIKLSSIQVALVNFKLAFYVFLRRVWLYLCRWDFWWGWNLSNISIEIYCFCKNDIDIDPCKIIHEYIWWILKLSTHRFISLQNRFQISSPFYQWIICLDMKYVSFCSSFSNFCDWK